MNVGRNESNVRILLGVACLGAACTVERLGGWRWLLTASGAAELITGLTRYCPVNQALGIDNTPASTSSRPLPGAGSGRPAPT